jgi:hypothetical protein
VKERGKLQTIFGDEWRRGKTIQNISGDGWRRGENYTEHFWRWVEERGKLQNISGDGWRIR